MHISCCEAHTIRRVAETTVSCRIDRSLCWRLAPGDVRPASHATRGPRDPRKGEGAGAVKPPSAVI
eukprot:3056843-Prymnesium_polylepis.1